MTAIFSTDSVPLADRRAYWHDAVCKTLLRVDVTTPKDFSGRIVMDQLGPIKIATVDAGKQLVRRTGSQIAGSPDDYLLLHLQTRGPHMAIQDGRTAALRPGELTLIDTTRPYTLQLPESSRTVAFQIPRGALSMSESDLRHVTGITIGAERDLATLVVPFLSRLAADVGTYRAEVAEMLASNLWDLLTTVFLERLGRDSSQTDAAHCTLLLRIKGFINTHLKDPALSAEVVAAAHHVSVRHLHRLFKADGATVSGWIRSRRLEECRRELGRPHRTRPTVASVAHRWGFVSPAHFSRAFRAAYSMSPREWQAFAAETTLPRSPQAQACPPLG